MFYTIYKTTNKINGKIYVGAHKTKDLDDGYLGSGLHLGYAIEKYGVENFEKEILAVFDNKKDMFNMESELVNEDFVENKNTYNLKLGGHGGFDHLNDGSADHIKRAKLGRKRANENGALIKATLASAEKRKDPKWQQQKTRKYLESINKYYQTHDGNFKGKKHTNESKRKIGEVTSKAQKGSGNSQYGTMWIMNLKLQQCRKIKKDDPIPEGWVKGRKYKF